MIYKLILLSIMLLLISSCEEDRNLKLASNKAQETPTDLCICEDNGAYYE